MNWTPGKQTTESVFRNVVPPDQIKGTMQSEGLSAFPPVVAVLLRHHASSSPEVCTVNTGVSDSALCKHE